MPRLASLPIAALCVAALIVPGIAAAQTPPTKPAVPPAKPTVPAQPNAKAPDRPAAAAPTSYTCDEGKALTVVQVPKAGPRIRVSWNDTSYFLRPAKPGATDAWEHKGIKLTWRTTAEGGVLEREGSTLATCKAAALR